MTNQPVSAVTQLLDAAAQGDAAAANRLWSTVYQELHGLARAQLAREGPSCSLQSTSLVNEAYLRLIGDGHVKWTNRRHFFSAAAKAMRRICVDDARRRERLKRSGRPAQPVGSADASDWSARAPGTLLGDPPAPEQDPAEVLAIEEALQKLEQHDPRRAELVMLRYFAGLNIDETAAALGVSARTVDTEWRFAKAWLHRELSKGDSTCCGRSDSDDH